MSKSVISAFELDALRRMLQVATLDALMSTRRWAPGDVVFRGGTSLHLVHGSPCFSDDLDFLVRNDLDLTQLGTKVYKRLEGISWIPAGKAITVSRAKEARNPHSFVVSVLGPSVIHSVKVKVELWRTPAAVLNAVETHVSPVRLPSGPGAGVQAFVPSLDLGEIYADKVFAIAARPVLKPRGVFDLHWLIRNARQGTCSVDAMRVRLESYPRQSPMGWLASAHARREELLNAGARIARDLRRWLPSSWPLDAAIVKAMIEDSVTALDQGISAMKELEDHEGGGGISPSAPGPVP